MLPISLSSCANISQYLLPITTGDNINWPYKDVLSSTKDFFGDSTNPSSSYGQYSSYLPKNFLTYINRSASNSVSSYGYMDPQDIKHGGQSPTNGIFNSFGYGYYGTNDKKMQYINEDDKNATIRSFQNLNQIIVTSAISSISSTLSSLFETMIHFLSQTGVIFGDNRATWINNLLDNSSSSGDSWHGDKGTPENQKFYEFLFDTNNLLSTGKSHYRFDIGSLDFKFTNSFLIDKTNCLGAQADNTIANTSQLYNVYTSKKFDPDGKNQEASPIADNQINDYVQAYASYADCENKTSDDKIYHYLSRFAYPIPTILRTSSQPAMQFTYYDPTKNHGFIPNEYLDIDMEKVKDKINNSRAWKSIEGLTGTKPKDMTDITQKYAINTNNDSLAVPSSITTSDYEPALKNILNPANLATYKKSDFIALTSNNVLSYKLPADDHSEDFYKDVTDANGNDAKNNDARNVHIPIFSGVQQNVYPIGLLFKEDSDGNQIFDTDLLTQKTKAIYIDPKTNKARDGHDQDSDKLQYLDLEKLNDKFAQFMSFLTTLVKKNTNPNDYQIKYRSKYYVGDIDVKYYSKLFKDILGSANSTTWLKPIQ